MAAFARILFPTDFSNGAVHPLENALCLLGVREVIVQHVVSTHFEKHSHWSTLVDIHEMQKYMDMYAETDMKKIMPRTVANTVTFRTKVMAAALLSDLFEFEQAREEESQAEQVYRQASDAFPSHRKDHGC